LFGSHPEFGTGALLLGWGEGAKLLTHALAGAKPRATDHHPPDTAAPWRVEQQHPTSSPASLACQAADSLRRVAERFERLGSHEVRQGAAAWLTADMAGAFHGTSADTA